MFALILLLVGFGLVLVVFTYFNRRDKPEEPEITIQIDEECCGAHTVCERDTLLNSENVIIYYDDEELDALADILPVDLTDQQIKQLSGVFYTLKESDVSGWLRSIQMRRIQLPVQLREEALLIVSERRNVNN